MRPARLPILLPALLTLFLLNACAFEDKDMRAEPVIDGDTIDGDIIDGDTIDGDTIDGDAEDEGEIETPTPFSFAIITDTHVRLPGNPDDGHYDNQGNLDNMDAAIALINSDYPDIDFVAHTGDLVGALFSENPDDYGTGDANPAETFKEKMDVLTVPYYAVLGNHDYQNSYDPEIDEGITTSDISAIEGVWKKVLDIDPYYAVVHKGIRFLYLNANRGELRENLCTMCTVEAFCTGSFDSEQIEWLEEQLAIGDPVIIMMHHPPVTDTASAMFSFSPTFMVDAEDAFYDVLEPEKDHVLAIFSGHGHIFEHDTLFGSIEVYETSSIGDTNGHPENIHIVDVDPSVPSVEVSIVREGVEYWSDMMSGEKRHLLYKPQPRYTR